MKKNLRVKDHMLSLGFSPSKKTAKFYYALLLDHGLVSSPRSLRGTRKLPFSGFLCKRKFEFIMKYQYGVLVDDIDRALSGISQSCMDRNISFHDIQLDINVHTRVKIRVNLREKTILSCKLITNKF